MCRQTSCSFLTDLKASSPSNNEMVFFYGHSVFPDAIFPTGKLSRWGRSDSQDRGERRTLTTQALNSFWILCSVSLWLHPDTNAKPFSLQGTVTSRWKERGPQTNSLHTRWGQHLLGHREGLGSIYLGIGRGWAAENVLALSCNFILNPGHNTSLSADHKLTLMCVIMETL